MKPTRPFSASATTRRRTVQYGMVFIGLVLVTHALVSESGLSAMLRARAQYKALEQSLAQARARNTALKEEARRYREDPSAIEEVARRDHGMIRDGEKVFIIRDIVPAELPPGR